MYRLIIPGDIKSATLTQIHENRREASDDLRARLSSLTPDEVKALGVVHRDYQRKIWLRSTGKINIVLGGLTLIFGLTGFSQSWLSQVQTVLGVLTITLSLWTVFAPTSSAILRLTCLLSLLGSWNLFLFVACREGILTGGLGIFQLWWAWQAYKAYRSQQLQAETSQQEAIQLYDEAWSEIRNGAFLDEREGIHLWIGRNLWYGLLLENKAIFVSNNEKLLVIQDKEDLDFIAAGSNPLAKKRIYGRIKFNTNSGRAMMKNAMFEKYVQWKGQALNRAIVSPTTEYFSRSVRFVILIAIGFMLLILASAVAVTLLAPIIFHLP